MINSRAFSYQRRVLGAYTFGRHHSALSFWHERPCVNPTAFRPGSWAYYMTFHDKAEYQGPFDAMGVPRLDYMGDTGIQYNPIAVAQYGLAWWNRTDGKMGPDSDAAQKVKACADWLVENLETVGNGNRAWTHRFDWRYYRTLKAPWYSGLAQGQGISLLVRAFLMTGDFRYFESAMEAWKLFMVPWTDGGVVFPDSDTGDLWIEEYLTRPPTHILNGMIWALWGVRDWKRLLDDILEGGIISAHTVNIRKDGPILRSCRDAAADLWEKGIRTLERNLRRYDTGYWSVYDLAPLPMKNPASAFYHSLHIVQLDVMHRLTGSGVFAQYRDRWTLFSKKFVNRLAAVAMKLLFKALFY